MVLRYLPKYDLDELYGGRAEHQAQVGLDMQVLHEEREEQEGKPCSSWISWGYDDVMMMIWRCYDDVMIWQYDDMQKSQEDDTMVKTMKPWQCKPQNDNNFFW